MDTTSAAAASEQHRRIHQAATATSSTCDLTEIAAKHNPLFWSCEVGSMNLSHRVVLAPLTRCRALDSVPQAAHVEYYTQRAAVPGGLLITEANAVAPEAFGLCHTPGIYTEDQVEAWAKVVDAVHAKGCFIICQLWHVGRASHFCYQPDGAAPVSPTRNAIKRPFLAKLPNGQVDNYSEPRALATQEIPVIVQQFRRAARNAIIAGFDGVEVHAAHGYLVDQFLKDGINDRIDQYGGSLENRCRFLLEIVEQINAEIGAGRTSVRLSPLMDHNDAVDSNPSNLALYLIEKLNDFKLAYLHVTEPRFHTVLGPAKETDQNLQIYRDTFHGLFMATGGYTREDGMRAIRKGYADLISYGRLFISNPDLPLRFALNSTLNEYDRSTFYTHDQRSGYTDYPSLCQLQQQQQHLEEEEEEEASCHAAADHGRFVSSVTVDHGAQSNTAAAASTKSIISFRHSSSNMISLQDQLLLHQTTSSKPFELGDVPKSKFKPPAALL
ncbi:hypothetical protein CY35_16G040800 [Sphagnum magellanicum]|nr:hypothetical protein CY35_16G040800 [Sphagnum magellanicum]